MTENKGVLGGVRLIKMLVELHRRGYQRLRIFPYLYPLAWRLEFAPSHRFSSKNGAYFQGEAGVNEDGVKYETARYSSADEYKYFGWTDAQHMDAEKLAGLFVERFPILCKGSIGRDWEYAGWVSELSGYVSRTHSLPYVMAEYFEPGPEELDYLPFGFNNPSTDFPLPPPPEAGAGGFKSEAAELRVKLKQIRARVDQARKLLDLKTLGPSASQGELLLD